MKKIFLILALFNVFAFLAPAGFVAADGMIMPKPDYYMNENGQRAVIFYDKGIETMIVSVSFEGDAKDFAWIVPTPKKPEVSKGSDEIFTSLEEITKKYQGYQRDTTIMLNSAGSPSSEEGVTIIETKKIDYYDVAVLSATDSGALTKWLSDNGYQYPEDSAYILNDYINNGWYFVAVKISPEAAGATEITNGLESGHATPLKLEFASDAIIYPMKISSIEINQNGFNLSSNVVLNQRKIKELKNIGYNELADKKNGPIIFTEIVQDLMNGSSYENSIASNYSSIISKRDFEDQMRCGNSVNCRYQVESWFNNYFSSLGISDNYYYNYVPVYIYVIADGKKEIPEFYTDYANWIKSNDIRDLAYNVNGKSLITPEKNKYYLTSLYRNMQKSDMTDDLVIRAAENNDQINAPNPGKNALWISLIALGSIFVWMISPLGLFFIIGTIVWILVKSSIFRTFARVFQIISVVITISLPALFNVIALKFGQVIPKNIWLLGIAIAFGLIFLGQIIVMIKIRKIQPNNITKS
jgi:hypothetical protein